MIYVISRFRLYALGPWWPASTRFIACPGRRPPEIPVVCQEAKRDTSWLPGGPAGSRSAAACEPARTVVPAGQRKAGSREPTRTAVTAVHWTAGSRDLPRPAIV
jgi:hypothetical protein